MKLNWMMARSVVAKAVGPDGAEYYVEWDQIGRPLTAWRDT